MTETKRKLQLAGAIISIVSGACSAVFFLLTLIVFSSFSKDFLINIGMPAEFLELGVAGILIGTLVIMLIYCVAIIVCGAIMCTNPAKKNTEFKGLTITLLVLNIISFLIYVSSLTTSESVFSILKTLACLTCIGLFIASLCVKKKPSPLTDGPVMSFTPEETLDSHFESAEEDKTESLTKIDKIRELHKEGIISEEEMKQLIMKELDK